MASNLFNILTGRTDTHLVSFGDYFIHKDALASFQKLQALAKKEINADLAIISSFRSFERQETIWNRKATGQTVILDKNQEPLDIDKSTPAQIIEAILRWSAIPGASRHHWGTDIDIFDSNKLPKEQVKLIHSESEPGGPFYELHAWLDEKIQANESCGFFRPYNTDRGEFSVGVEKWHLSYAPISNEYLSQYSLELFQENLVQSNIEFKRKLLQSVNTLYKNYVKNIDKIPF